MTRRSTTGLVAAFLLLGGTQVVSAAPAEAQEDLRWLPWIGCWVEDGGAPSNLLCIDFADAGAGVELVAVAEGEVVSTERIVADGQRSPRSGEGCEGYESAGFSPDGRRVDVSSEYVCGADVMRTSSGVFAIVATDTWIDVQSVTVDGESAVRVLRYRSATPGEIEEAGRTDPIAGRRMAALAARQAAASRFGVDDVIALSDELEPGVLAALLSHGDGELDVDADALIRMADAGVPDEVIDVTVALAYPEHFRVGSSADVDRDEPRYARGYRRYVGGYYDPFWGPYRYSRGSFFYSGFSVGGFGYYPRGFYGHVPVIVRVHGGDGIGDSGGRWVPGRGYRGRSGRSRSDTPGVSERGVQRRGSATASGGSRGGSSSSSKRKAKRRGGGA